MAWRNVWRNRRRSLITIGAMTLSLTVLILYTSLIEGYLFDLENSILDLEVGDFQIHRTGYLEKPSIHERIEDAESILTVLKANGFPSGSRLQGGGLVAAGDSSAGALLKGIKAETDLGVSQISQHVGTGQWLSDEDPKGVVLGRRLARTIDAGIGDELIALGQAADGSLANDIFYIRGILMGVSDETDRSGVYVLEDEFREFFAVPNGVHEIIARKPKNIELDSAKEKIQTLLPGLEVRSWKELMPTLASLMESTQGVILIMFIVFYIVVAILILNATLMAVFERIKEFGVMKALGLSPVFVLSLILIESGIQVALSILIGISASIPGLYYLTEVGIDTGSLAGMPMMGIAMASEWRGMITPYVILGPVVTLTVMALLASIYPAVKAARISPVEAMRHQ